ncbi:MAG: DUF378 domain-containing protein [Simkaniaceae bacterium]|nr:DUF378 domain-containing protein [Candidatus Sacchlamyda saccharinae]
MKKFISVVAYILVIVGALNWGLWGFFQFDLVAWLFGGNTTWISRIVYSLVGLSGLWALGSFGRCCKAMCCKPGCCSTCGSKKEEGPGPGHGQ